MTFQVLLPNKIGPRLALARSLMKSRQPSPSDKRRECLHGVSRSKTWEVLKEYWSLV